MAAQLLEAPRFAVLKTSGVNRDFATQAALEIAGTAADVVHINEFLQKTKRLADYQGLFLPGGFSHGDDIQSGVIWALQLHQLADELKEHALQRKRPIVGICNGFQALVQTGLLPFGEMTTRDKLQATLTNNDSGKFESRWIHVKPQKSVCLFVAEDNTMIFPVAHGEGKFVTSQETYQQMAAASQIVWRYTDEQGNTAQEKYPANPNGSPHDVAGVTNPEGTVLGGMPHPEDYIRKEHYPNWRRQSNQQEPDGLRFFKNVVLYARGL